jgi:Ca-activated chloride channel family protein
VYELVYPTVVGPRYSNQPKAGAPPEDRFIQSPYGGQGQAPSYSFALSGRISSPIAIQDLSIPTHKAVLAWPSKSEVRFSLDPSERAGGNRDLVLRYRLAGAVVQSGLLLHQGPRENFFLLMVEPPARVAAEQIPSREYIFILDVSGSMYGFPLDTAKALLRRLAGGLRPVDSFNVILFSGRHELLAPRSVPASRENIDRALAIIDARQVGGGTELLPALREAMLLPSEPGRSRSFVVVTDGYIAQEKEAFHFIRKNLGKANVFSFGIGSSVNRHLVEGVARAGMGEPFVVTEPGEAPAIAARFQAYIESPVLTDIEVSYDEFAAYDVQPLPVPDLMARRPIIIHGKWAGEARGTIAVKGKAGNGNYRVDIDVSRSSPSKRHQALSYLWARSRLADLADLSGGGETEEEKQEVIALGLTYNLLTRHTSFLAVHQEVRNRAGGAVQVAQPLPLPDGVSDYAVGVESGSEPELLFLLALLVLALLGTRGRRRATPAPHA